MRNILSYFKKQKLLCILFIILGIITTVLGILEPKLTSNMLTALTEGKLDQMELYVIWVAITAIALAIVKFLVRNTSVVIRSRVGKALQTDLCKRALNIKSGFISEFKSGELTEITKSDSINFLNIFQEVVMLSFSIVTSAAVAIYITVISWQCAVLFACFLSIIFGIQKYSLNKEKKNSKKEKDSNDIGKSIVNQIYRGILDIKVLDLKTPIFEKYDSFLDREISAKKAKEYTKSSNRLFSNISFEIYVLGFMLFGIWLMKTGYLSSSDFITIFMYKSYLYNLIFNIAECRSAISEMKVLASRMNKLLEIEEYKLENFGELNGSNSSKHTIDICNLSFSYGNNVNVLNDISVNFKEGEFIGIVGESGSAKTTLLKLLSRQLEPKVGSIKLDGINYNEYSTKGFTSLISLASQEPFIFSFSIRENLLMVKPTATETELWKCLEDAQIIDFVKNLPNGIDTVLKETLNISGGQKQRLSLARLFLKDSPILLMDEATSALDNKTQAEITSLIQKKTVQDKKIFICIAHRIEAIQNADKILFLERGKIANSGTHAELLHDARYSKLLNKSLA